MASEGRIFLDLLAFNLAGKMNQYFTTNVAGKYGHKNNVMPLLVHSGLCSNVTSYIAACSYHIVDRVSLLTNLLKVLYMLVLL